MTSFLNSIGTGIGVGIGIMIIVEICHQFLHIGVC